MNFKDLTIRKKLITALLLTSATAVLMSSLTFYLFMIDRIQSSYQENLTSLTKIVSHNCQAALAFNIPEDAEIALQSLQNRTSIAYAAIHDNHGKLFTEYRQDNHLKPDLDNMLLLQQNILLNNSVIGTLAIYDTMQPINDTRKMMITIQFIVTIVVLVAVYFLSALLQKLISDPIISLAETTRVITENHDYSVRAIKVSKDEVGVLVDSFNAMLVQIEKSDSALRSSESRFRNLVDQAVDSFFLLDMAGNVLDVNQRASDSLGYPRNALLNLTFRDFDNLAAVSVERAKPWTNSLPDHPLTQESEFRRKDGMFFPVELRMGLLDIDGEQTVMVLARDISERKEEQAEKRKLENQLIQSQKMESIGTLAGGIAHDFNNILTAILGYAELAKQQANSEGLTVKIDAITKAGWRARELVKQILTFSRQTVTEKSAVEIGPIIKEALKLLRASIPTTIEIREHIDSQCGTVFANPTQVHQILMNLCTNSYHAMREKGGVLGVTLDTMEINTMEKAAFNLVPGHYLRLIVSDNGSGMDTATQERAMDPYFTTKPKGEGTGMGLAIVHGIVKSLDGHLSIYSEPGKGTTVKVYLPIVKKAESVSDQWEELPIQGGNEHILIVDDELTITNLEKEMLETLGYKISVCNNPNEALSKYRQQPQDYDLIITDMTMPHMTGAELAKAILAIEPHQPIILCTGFSDIIDETIALKLGIRKFLTKPVTMGEFSTAIRAALQK
ncbi:MAG: response regulator [Desulfobulbaceae bacterium]|nr:response regulator [Desulfobulbaceae bacterium]HIJ78150.1 response regulator [Deltaproteobacteria bacterium]